MSHLIEIKGCARSAWVFPRDVLGVFMRFSDQHGKWLVVVKTAHGNPDLIWHCDRQEDALVFASGIAERVSEAFENALKEVAVSDADADLIDKPLLDALERAFGELLAEARSKCVASALAPAKKSDAAVHSAIGRLNRALPGHPGGK